MKILIRAGAILATAAVVAATVMPVLADTATNDTTGAESTNMTSVKNINSVSITNVSDAYINNDVKSFSSTGHNVASENTMGGTILTGDARTEVSILNSANINTNLVNLGASNGGSTAGNSITGHKSGNFADVLNQNSVNVLNDNTAVLQNKVCASSSTGGNVADENTDGNGGTILTGDATTLVSLQNRVNDSATQVSGLGSFGVNVLGNSITGAESTNMANIKNLNSVVVSNISDASILNDVHAFAKTGHNFANENTMGGAVLTGDAQVGLELLTDANINTTAIDAGMDETEAISGNSITGHKSVNFTDLLNQNSISVLNENNKGLSRDAGDYKDVKWGVVNKDFDVADTGGNVADENTYPSSIATGIAMAGKLIRVCLNDTLTTIGAFLPM